MDALFDHASAEAAEGRGDWAAAIAVVSGFSECYSHDHYRHNAHLWHMELLVRAGLLHELAELAKTDVHARRRLDRFLFEDGRGGELRRRAERGDKTATNTRSAPRTGWRRPRPDVGASAPVPTP